jgi:hypothetical protein
MAYLPPQSQRPRRLHQRCEDPPTNARIQHRQRNAGNQNFIVRVIFRLHHPQIALDVGQKVVQQSDADHSVECGAQTRPVDNKNRELSPNRHPEISTYFTIPKPNDTMMTSIRAKVRLLHEMNSAISTADLLEKP